MPGWIMRALRGCNLLDNQDDDISHQFWTDDKEDVEEYISTHWTELVGKDLAWFLVKIRYYLCRLCFLRQ
jgi:hypothetical protein